MTPSELAAALGRRGGRARAARLSQTRRREIAGLGNAARLASLQASRRIASNFRYLELVRALAPPPKVRPVATCRGSLPGLYPHRDED